MFATCERNIWGYCPAEFPTYHNTQLTICMLPHSRCKRQLYRVKSARHCLLYNTLLMLRNKCIYSRQLIPKLIDRDYGK